MQLTVGQIHNLYVGLTVLERNDKLKLTPDTRFKMAINLNVLEPVANGYERARTRALADLYRDNRKLEDKKQRTEAEIQADLADADAGLRAKTEEVELRMLSRTDLKLDENETLLHATLARLLPLVEGLELAEPKAEPKAKPKRVGEAS